VLDARPLYTAKRFLRRIIKGKPPAAPEGLYFHPHDYRWFRQEIGDHWDVSVWRSISVPTMRRWLHGAFGRWMLAGLFRIESAFPRCFGRHGISRCWFSPNDWNDRQLTASACADATEACRAWGNVVTALRAEPTLEAK
jgi:hypothetical protein